MVHIDDPDTQRANIRYIKSSMKEAMLERDEEKELALRWKENLDEVALHKLICAYTKLVISTASKFKNYALPMGDLIQEGNVGLMQSAARFDPERDIRFSTYATWWIRSAMQDYVLRNWSIVRTGTTAAQKTLFFNLRRLRARINDGPNGGMTTEGRKAVAILLKVPLRDVEAMEGRMSTGDQSLHATVSNDYETNLQDFVPDERPTPDMLAEETLDTSKRAKWLNEAICQLPIREQMIINKRRLIEDRLTLEELGQQLGVSKERVRQLESRAMDKIKISLMQKVETPKDLLIES